MTAYSLGRVVEHDERSRLYQARTASVPRSVLWGHHAPVLDQGNIGACTGHALAQCLNTDYFTPARPAGYLTHQDALNLYSVATHLDSVPGSWPPDDTGSSGIAVCKAGKRAGYLTGYTHAFSFQHFCAALQTQPLIVGTSWYEAMFTVDRRGFVHPGGQVAGGHEYLALGVDYERGVLTFLNSWSESWGRGGRFKMSFADFSRLLAEQGDATAPLGTHP